MRADMLPFVIPICKIASQMWLEMAKALVPVLSLMMLWLAACLLDPSAESWVHLNIH